MPKIRRCPECNGIVKPGKTELTYELEKISITVKNIPTNICTKCNRSFIDGHVAEDVNRLVNRVTEDVNSFSKTHPQIEERHSSHCRIRPSKAQRLAACVTQ